MNNFKWQALILIILALIAFMVTKIKIASFENSNQTKLNQGLNQVSIVSEKIAFQADNTDKTSKKTPVRLWDILDPEIVSEAVLIQSLENDFPFFKYNTSKIWPIASLTKLLTAVVVLEDIGKNKKIPINESAVLTEGETGDLKSGEIYQAEDLLKIMLLTSSNDAAAAFEEYLGGKDTAVRVLNNKIAKLGMNQTIVHDASGLSDLNESTVNDLLVLLKYIVKNEPEILNWTRLPNFLVQPLNDPKSRIINNINGFINDMDFLGGKTGTSPEAKENLAAVFALDKLRTIVILLGSENRISEVKKLLDWTKKAYIF
ncbi:MAG: serine hydrolase [Patescibacteria group bacterium]|nr:serine hydrolase [Patescibacteria group bacterium]